MTMISRIIALCVCVAACGCLLESARKPVLPTVWQASVDNGDKPGNGIRLMEHAGRISATFFLLDPNKPHDFKAGRELPTEVVEASETAFRIVVRIDENRKDELTIVLEAPLTGERVNATLRGEGIPIALTFVKLR